MDIIGIDNISKVFRDKDKKEVRALDSVSFSVKKGEIVGLLGANGAGKTTLITILCGLLEKTSGKATIFGMDIDKEMLKIKPRINIVSGFTMVNLSLSVREYLKYFTLLYDIRDASKKIEEVMKLVGIKDKERVQMNHLSAGYKQRVLLAKGLLNDPEIIFMDEPTVGLDVSIAIRIRKIIGELKKKGTTIIFTSHNLTEVEQLCDRIVLISKGKIVQIGSIEDIKKRIRNNRILEIICKDNQRFAKAASSYPEVENVRLLEGKVIVEAKSADDVSEIMKKAINQGFLILSMRRIEPTLEEAFLNIINGENDDN